MTETGASKNVVGRGWAASWPRRSGVVKVAVPLALGIVLAIAPVAANGYQLYLLTLAAIYAVVGIGFNVIVGWCGQLAFTSAAFFGIGAFAAGWTSNHVSGNIFVTLGVALCVGAGVGVLLGALVGRLQRYYLAMATIAFMFALQYGYQYGGDTTGGVSGFAITPPSLRLTDGVSLSLASDNAHYYVAVAISAAIYLVARWLRQSAIGRGWRCVAESEPLAEAVGVNVYRSKVIAFGVSSAMMALAGGWFVLVTARFLPETYGLDESIFHFLIAIIGGLGTINGMVVGALILVVGRQYLGSFAGLSELLFGCTLLIVVLFMRKGIYGSLARRFRWLREGVL